MGSTGAELAGLGFFAEISRHELTSGILSSGCSLVALVAPPGWGKSILARQIGQAGEFPQFVWADCSDVGAEPEHLLRAVANSIDSSDGLPLEQSCLLPSEPNPDMGLLAELIKSRLGAIRTCLVLDELSPDVSSEVLAGFLQLCGNALLGTGSMVVLTSPCEAHVRFEDVARHAYLVGTERLRFSNAEIAGFLRCNSPQESTDVAAKMIAEISQGQPALVRLLASTYCLSGIDGLRGEVAWGDLSLAVRAVITPLLSADQLRLVYAAAILERGWVSDLERVVEGLDFEDVVGTAHEMPLIRVFKSDGVVARFELAGALSLALRSPEFADLVPGSSDIRYRGCQLLRERDRAHHVVRLAIELGDREVLTQAVSELGNSLLDRGRSGLLETAMGKLAPSDHMRHPWLLLLNARLLRERGRRGEALRKTQVACDLARHDADENLEIAALLLMARLQMDTAEYASAAQSLEQAMAAGDGLPTADDEALAQAYLGVCLQLVGDSKASRPMILSAMTKCGHGKVSTEVHARVLTAAAASDGLLGGDWAKAHERLLRIDELEPLSRSVRIQNECNRGTVLMELGRLDRARSILEAALVECSERGLDSSTHAIMGSLASTLGGLGEVGLADELMVECLRACDERSDRAEASISLAYQSTWKRAVGENSVALGLSETALEHCSGGLPGRHEWLAILETAASLLSLGDTVAACTRASKVRKDAEAAGAQYHVLRADMILAEADRREGDQESAVARLRQNEAYILTESSNWQIAMYIRSFPGLLGVLASAIDPERLPAHLLGMVLPTDAEDAIMASRAVMEPDAWRRLAVRLVGEAEAARIVGEPTAPVCRVRLFGGLGVTVGDRPIPEKSWRKRKARLVFAMLCLRQGRDVPREQLMEHLWPEMGEERARNNFYVIWSAMKGALSPEAGRSEPCPYVENAGGVCRTVRSLVRSDIDEFDRLLQRAHDADGGGEIEAAIRALESLATVYTGDLMPGDLYEDWFAAARERYRHEFSDAMVRASELCLHEGDAPRALALIRRALTLDPWREDLYQVALRCQIACEQRSAAIDTYMSCRSRLADDLGIDPSAETTRLYEQVLAMEERASVGDALFSGQRRDEEEVTDPSKL